MNPLPLSSMHADFHLRYGMAGTMVHHAEKFSSSGEYLQPQWGNIYRFVDQLVRVNMRHTLNDDNF